MTRKQILSIVCLAFIFLLSVGAEAQNPPDRFQLTILHVNDTHSHLESMEAALTFNGEKTYLDWGGFARLLSKIKQLRSTRDNLLLLHAGDAVQGTLYFTKYGGVPECEFLNLLGVDAMVTGNHEFDKGSELLANFIRQARFPVLAANLDVSADPHLNGLTRPYVITEFGDEKVGIIGLVTPDTPETSNPSRQTAFNDPRAEAAASIQALEALGIRKIVLLTHLGYPQDIELARRVEGIDVIVGGHTHTLLGDVKPLGLTAEGAYPTQVPGPSGHTVCIAQAWEWAKVFGILEIDFDPEGHVTRCSGDPVLLVGDTFKQKDPKGVKRIVTDAKKAELLAWIAENPLVSVTPEDPSALEMLAPYKAGVDAMQHQVIGAAADDLWHERVPGAVHRVTGKKMESGSELAPLAARTLLWKVDGLGMNVRLAILNAGGVRTDIPKGDLTVGKVVEVFPFANTLVVMDLAGKDIKQIFEIAVTRTLDPERDGAFLYVAGARYTADLRRADGDRITCFEVRTAGGGWEALDPHTVYRVVTNSYLAGGGDGYTILKAAKGYRYDTGFNDAEVFMEYVQAFSPLRRPESTGVTYISR